MNKKIYKSIIISAIFILSACKQENSNQYMGKYQYPGPPPDNKLLWSKVVDGKINTTPIVAQFWTPIINNSGTETNMKKNEQVVLLGTSLRQDLGELNAIDYKSATVKWSNRYNSTITSTPSLIGENAFFGLENGTFYALNVITGKEKWKFSAAGMIKADSVTDENNVYFGTKDGLFYCLDSETGKEKWKLEIKNEINNTPLIYKEDIYFGSDDGNLYSVNKNTGAISWKFKTNGKVETSPVAANGVVYAISSDKNLHAIKADTGEFIWSLGLPTETKATPSVNTNRNRIYVASGKKILFVNLSTGKVDRDLEMPEAIENAIINLSGYIYVTDNFGKLYYIDETNLEIKWRYQGVGNKTTAPFNFNGILHYGTDEGVIYAVGRNEEVYTYAPVIDKTEEILQNRKGKTQFRMAYNVPSGAIPSGRLKWSYNLEQEVTTSPAFSNDFLYVGAGLKLFSLRTDSDLIQWNYETNGIVKSSPNIVSRKLYFSSSDGKIRSINPDNKDKFWNFKADGPVHTSVYSVNDLSFFGSDDHNIYALNSVGALKWKFKTQAPVRAMPISHKNIVYCGSNDGYFYAINEATGEELWKFKTGGAIEGACSIIENKIYFGSKDKKMYCLNLEDKGAKVWEFQTEGEVVSTPSLFENGIYFGSKDKKMYALDKETGKKLWNFQTEGEITGSTSIVDSRLYFGSWDSKIYSLLLEGGKKVWEYKTEFPVKTTPLVINGILYMGSGTTFYAIK